MRAMLALVAIAIPAVLFAADPPKPAIPTGIGPGYLDMASVPVSVNLAPPPPAPGSGAEARDIEAQRAALALHGTPRWAWQRLTPISSLRARQTRFPVPPGSPSVRQPRPKPMRCCARPSPTLASPPGRQAQVSAPRPFMVNNAPQCTPEAEAVLRHDGSYPSGHSTIGYGWGAIARRSCCPARATNWSRAAGPLATAAGSATSTG